ncbi:unnamed protein product [Owenia fusiformis]|uniref:Uncharacterized protein n=1 Tax=Owenia fusiformis TaxID=6347 RepID=A0A8J1TNS1_OWEFU|nr:unnamed protein product [Owenia fusiformis]
MLRVIFQHLGIKMITNHPQETSQASKLAVYREQKKLSHRLDKISICEERARKHSNAYQRRVEYELFGHPVRKSTGRYNKSYKEKRNRVLDTKNGTETHSMVKLPTIKQDAVRSRRSKKRRVQSPDIAVFPNISAAQSVDNILDERQVKYMPRNVDIKKERRPNDSFQRFITEKQSNSENDGNQKPLLQSTEVSGGKDSMKNTSNARKRRLLKKYGRRWLRKTIRKPKGSGQNNPKIPRHHSDPEEEPPDLTNFISKMLEQYRTQKDDNNRDTDFLESKTRKSKNIGGKYYASTAKLFATVNNTKGIGDRKKATSENVDMIQRRSRGRRDDKHFRRMSVVMQNSAMFVQGLEWENTDEQTTL